VLDTGEPYLVMELLQGQSLADLLEENERIAEQDAIAWLAQACDGLQAAHDAGIIHRDIKPENLFVERSGRLKILDFGISKFDPGLTGEQQLTGDLTLGTPYYMAPEQTTKASSVDQRSDVYAMGVVLYECVTGKKPFNAETYPQLIVQIHLGDYAPASSILPTTAALEVIIAKAMARRPEERFQSPAALASALRDVARATERTQSPFDSTRRAGDIEALLEQHRLPQAPLGLAATERPVEAAAVQGSRPSPPRASSPPLGLGARAAGANDPTLVSAGSEPPRAPAPARRVWPLFLVAALVAGVALWWFAGKRVGPVAVVDNATSAGVVGPVSVPSSAAAETPVTTTLAPAPSEAVHAPSASPAHPAQPAPPSAKSAQPASRAGQHDLEQENPFR
jgi:serine/threonine-protein kinase